MEGAEMTSNKKIIATLHRAWQLPDANSKRIVNITPGRYELEPIENPKGKRNPWLVLKGTKIGMPEGARRYWTEGPGDLKILLEEL
jgi:hypothetical protein